MFAIYTNQPWLSPRLDISGHKIRQLSLNQYNLQLHIANYERMADQTHPTTHKTVRSLSMFLLVLSGVGLYATFLWFPLSFLVPKDFVAVFGLLTSGLLLFETHEKTQTTGWVWIVMGLFLLAAVAVGWESPGYFGLLHVFIRAGDLPVLFLAGVTSCLLGLETPPAPASQRQHPRLQLRLWLTAATLYARNAYVERRSLTPFR